MGCSGGSLEDQNAEIKQRVENRLLKFQMGLRVLSDTWARGQSDNILTKNLDALCPYTENLNETELKNNKLMCLGEGILRQDSIQFVDW